MQVLTSEDSVRVMEIVHDMAGVIQKALDEHDFAKAAKLAKQVNYLV